MSAGRSRAASQRLKEARCQFWRGIFTTIPRGKNRDIQTKVDCARRVPFLNKYALGHQAHVQLRQLRWDVRTSKSTPIDHRGVRFFSARHRVRFKTSLKVAKGMMSPHQKSNNYEAARRCRATSKAATETATPAFNELIRPSCGIDTTVAHRLRVKEESPFSSPPTTIATGPDPRSRS